MKSKLVSKEV
jgi:hypothetical protein